MNHTKKTAATMSDVAREAGVALGTVSKVINGQSVGESYRLKVEAAVKKLNYQVNNNARSLKTDHTNTIAFPMQHHTYLVISNHISKNQSSY